MDQHQSHCGSQGQNKLGAQHQVQKQQNRISQKDQPIHLDCPGQVNKERASTSKPTTNLNRARAGVTGGSLYDGVSLRTEWLKKSKNNEMNLPKQI